MTISLEEIYTGVIRDVFHCVLLNIDPDLRSDSIDNILASLSKEFTFKSTKNDSLNEIDLIAHHVYEQAEYNPQYTSYIDIMSSNLPIVRDHVQEQINQLGYDLAAILVSKINNLRNDVITETAYLTDVIKKETEEVYGNIKRLQPAKVDLFDWGLNNDKDYMTKAFHYVTDTLGPDSIPTNVNDLKRYHLTRVINKIGQLGDAIINSDAFIKESSESLISSFSAPLKDLLTKSYCFSEYNRTLRDTLVDDLSFETKTRSLLCHFVKQTDIFTGEIDEYLKNNPIPSELLRQINEYLYFANVALYFSRNLAFKNVILIKEPTRDVYFINPDSLKNMLEIINNFTSEEKTKMGFDAVGFDSEDIKKKAVYYLSLYATYLLNSGTSVEKDLLLHEISPVMSAYAWINAWYDNENREEEKVANEQQIHHLAKRTQSSLESWFTNVYASENPRNARDPLFFKKHKNLIENTVMNIQRNGKEDIFDNVLDYVINIKNDPFLISLNRDIKNSIIALESFSDKHLKESINAPIIIASSKCLLRFMSTAF